MAEPKFHFNGTFVLLTYKGHVDREALKQSINRNSVKECVISHEVGDSGYEHTHAVIRFEKQVKKSSSKCWDFEGIHPNIKPLPGIKAFKDACEYAKKQDKAPMIQTVERGYVESILEMETLDEVFESQILSKRDVSLAIGLKEIYGRKKREVTPMTLQFKWQTELARWLEYDPDPRKITWIVDPIGNTGKTLFARHMCQTDGWYMIASSMATRDLGTVIQNAFAGGWTGKGFIIDLPRTVEDHDRIYEALECIKNGIITATKYSGKTEIFDTPHVIVMANWWPKVKMLSLDRWDIRELRRKEGELTLEYVPHSDVPEKILF